MTKIHFKCGFLIAIFSMSHHLTFSQTESTIENHPGIILERTESRTLHSDIVGQDYELSVSLPNSYSMTDTTYPVLFLLDPYRVFSMVKGLTEVFTTTYTIMPEVIIVGIGYGGEGMSARLNWALGRVRDYSPVRNTETEEAYEKLIEEGGMPNIDVESGGAPMFLDFIRKELFPFIEANYRIDTNMRILSGYSFGGLFGLYALFHDPDLFDKYFIGSPTIRYSNGITYEYEVRYASTHKDLEADVFMSSGALENRTADHLNKMADKLLSRNYKNLNLETFIFENESHVTCYPAALSRGLVELFNNNDDGE
jgi:predicted alpha/beta superfamily hydrolase